MYGAMAVGSIQGKSRSTVAEGEFRNSTLAKNGILASNKNSVKKGRCDMGWFKSPHRVVPLPKQPNLFLILRVIHVFVMQKPNYAFLHNLGHFY